ncbi:MAG: hypothetical protein CFE21_03030 [Bacteroidetes bacterium B1(2017)]|nr:MAG: hypothetical protein CFE21_03030 [Bacteroidetes bacterium B1(2017)]
MAGSGPRTKQILMDKAPGGQQLNVKNDLAYTTPDYDVLAAALNAAYGTSVTGAELEPLNTVQDVMDYMQNL